MFSAMSEIMLDLYQHMRKMNQYDPALETKLKNLKANFERVSKNAYGKFTDDEQLVFFYMISVFKKLIEVSHDRKKFDELMGIIDSWERNDLTMIESTQQLLETAELAKTRSYQYRQSIDGRDSPESLHERDSL